MDSPKSLQPIPKHARKVFEGVIFDVYQWEQEMFDGRKRTFEKVKRIDAASVIAITEDQKVIVLNQTQPGKDRYYSLPGGMLDDGESPLEAAKRELLEETGCVGELELFHAYQPISKMDWSVFLFVAKNCKKIFEQKLDGGEEIDIITVSMEEFVDIVLEQKIKNAQIIVKLLKENLLVIDKKETHKKIKNYFL